MVEALLITYNADANLLAGQLDLERGVRYGHVLEAALQHPRNICRSLLKMLLQHGASLFDISARTVVTSTLHLAIVRNQDALDIFAEYDSENFMYIITKFIWIEGMQCETPLTLAIKSGLENAAFKLLSYGAPPQLTFDSSLDTQADFKLPGKSAVEIAKERYWQPILAAAKNEMPQLVMKLLDHGADPNATLTDEQADGLFEFEYRDCRSVLDLIKTKLVQLRNWHKENELEGTPEELMWLTRKKIAIVRLIQGYEEAEARLVSLGAKVTAGVSLQEPSTPASLQFQKKIQSSASKTKEIHAQITQTSDVSFRDADFRKLSTLEEGHAAL